MSGVPATDSLERVSSRGTGDADDPISHGRGPLVADLVGRIAAFPLVLGSTAQPSAWCHSRSFHEFFTISSVFVTPFFHFLSRRKGFSRAAIKWLPEEINNAGRVLPAVSLYATLMPRLPHSAANHRFSRIFHGEKNFFSRWLVALSENLALVNDEQFCSTCNLGETR
jgi:hypothetical protein